MKINFKKRIYMTDVSINDVDSKVVVMGWVHKIRNKGKIIFLDLRDISGILQVIFEKDKIDDNYFKEAVKLHNEDIVYIEGIVKKRGENVNTNLKTGFIEVYAEKLIILSKADIIPFQIENDAKTKEELRLKYRYIDLKRKNLRNNLILRSNVCSIVRNFLKSEKFIEIETPILNRSTPEGARDYLVPSRVNPGKFYALPQSPQLFKQLLMCAGYDRYYQIARCFRDEDLRAERQPEFTQIDMELSFVDMDYIFDINERLLKKIFKEILDLDIKIPFKRITWKESMDKYGVDKPDLRYGMEIIDITDIAKNSKFSLFKNVETVRGIKVKNGFTLSNRQIKLLSEFVHDFNAKFISYIKISDNYNIKSSFDKYTSKEELSLIIDRFKAEKNDLIFIIADTIEVVRNSLGNLRCKISKDLDIINKNDYKFVWITEFPLFKYSKEKNRYVSNHHPFTKPVKEDIAKLDSDIINIKSQTYDIIVNGYELGGGSIRINDKDLQSKIFKILKIKDEDVKKSFGFLIDAFKYGVPPHGGLAYGLDRLVMLLAKTDNIRDVMAFPKNKDAKCLMSETPNSVESSQLNELNIKLIN